MQVDQMLQDNEMEKVEKCMREVFIFKNIFSLRPRFDET